MFADKKVDIQIQDTQKVKPMTPALHNKSVQLTEQKASRLFSIPTQLLKETQEHLQKLQLSQDNLSQQPKEKPNTTKGKKQAAPKTTRSRKRKAAGIDMQSQSVKNLQPASKRRRVNNPSAKIKTETTNGDAPTRKKAGQTKSKSKSTKKQVKQEQNVYKSLDNNNQADVKEELSGAGGQSGVATLNVKLNPEEHSPVMVNTINQPIFEPGQQPFVKKENSQMEDIGSNKSKDSMRNQLFEEFQQETEVRFSLTGVYDHYKDMQSKDNNLFVTRNDKKHFNQQMIVKIGDYEKKVPCWASDLTKLSVISQMQLAARSLESTGISSAYMPTTNKEELIHKLKKQAEPAYAQLRQAKLFKQQQQLYSQSSRIK